MVSNMALTAILSLRLTSFRSKSQAKIQALMLKIHHR